MKKYLIALQLLLLSLCNYAQSDTVVIKDQKGFLLLSSYNNQYDFKDGEVRVLGFHDYFFPANSFDSSWCNEENMDFIFKNGLRIDHIEKRKPLKDAAFVLNGIDTSGCYKYNEFHIIPVLISYKMFQDNWPYSCDRNFFDFQLKNGSFLHFNYLHSGSLPFKITPILNQKVKPKTNPAKKRK